ncbi:hypothetical protein [Nitrobacter sp.]|uniref:hypothetical protein n=1 Tax=Nitrobacter sp. TaxID=29420 RepID=UPI00399D7838
MQKRGSRSRSVAVAVRIAERSAHPLSISYPDQTLDARMERALNHLTSFHDSDGGVSEVLALGADAMPALAQILTRREPSGLFQARCRAVEALAALKAFSVLGDFLRKRRDVADPVERLGDDAVVGAAARAIARLREPWVYELLADLARHRPLQGILAGLGSFLCMDSLPVFVDALQEDHLRLTAEAILRGFGSKARPALMTAASEPGEGREWESDSHLRKRRSALGILSEIGLRCRDWPRLRPLIEDPDHQIALLACEIGIKLGNAADRARVAARLQALRPAAGWIHREQIDELTKSVERDQRGSQAARQQARVRHSCANSRTVGKSE